MPSSEATRTLLKTAGIPVIELNDVGELPLYIDSADAFTPHKQLIKGGGGALTREKIIASASKTFICIVDETKKSQRFRGVPRGCRSDSNGPKLCGT